jgi:hypothetical protein
MKVPVLVIILLASGFSLQAQQISTLPIPYGIISGSAFSTYVSRTPGNRSSGKILVGPVGGFFADFPVTTACYLQPSLLYTGKGGKDRVTGEALSLSYLELPLDFTFRPTVGGGNIIWAAFGPYIAYGIGGNTGTPGAENPFKGGQGGALNRFDAGGHVQVGYQTPFGLLIGFNEELGLSNILNNGDNNYAFRNNSFSFFIGYCFIR